jgi:hypothetical protein
MANARFLEILRCNGVDQNAAPHPGMIVPFGGENQVVLETSGMDLDVRNPVVKLQEFEGRELTTQLLRSVQEALSRPGVDPQQRDAFMPTMAWHKARFFRILGTRRTGFPGTFVNAVPRSARAGHGPAAVAKLEVAVVDRIVIKVAIRNVRARDAQGIMRFHARRPCDPEAEVGRMNAIWRPQTNIVFELVPSSDLDVDDRDARTREELRIAYGMKTPATFSAESTVWADRNSGWFAKHKVAGAHITFFVVHKLHSGGDPVYGKGGRTPNGTMNRQSGVSFVSDTRLPSTFAHEAGHFVGDMEHEGTDITLLMRGDGSGYRIPFGLAKRFRESWARRKKP